MLRNTIKKPSKTTKLTRPPSKNNRRKPIKTFVFPSTKRQFSASSTSTTTTTQEDIPRIQLAHQYPLCTISSLPSGTRIATEFHPAPLVNVSVAVATGSRYETAENNGTAHFLEHTLFKGTTKRSRQQLEMEIENMGASFNAFTTREQTLFTITAQKHQLPFAVEFLADVLQNSQISERSIENERPVILEEMESVAQDAQETTYDNLHRVSYQDTSLSFDILGPMNNIRKISKQDIHQYVKTHYTAPRVLVAGVGNIDHNEFQSLVAKELSKLPITSPIEANKGVAKWTSAMSLIDDSNRINRESTSIAIAFPTSGWNHPDHYSLMTLQMMLQNFQSLDEESAAFLTGKFNLFGSTNFPDLSNSYGIQPFNILYSDAGMFGLYAEIDGNNIQQFSKNLVRAFTGIVTNIDESNLEAAKSQLKSSLLSQYEGVDGTSQELCRQILAHGRRIHPSEIIARVDNVTIESINRVANDWLHQPNFSVSVVGPHPNMPTLDELKKEIF